MALSSAQTTQLNRITDSAFRLSLDDEKLEKYSIDQLRARVNIRSVTHGKTIVWSEDCDYTAAQQTTIQDGFQPGEKAVIRASEILAAGLSIKQRLAALEA